MSELLLDRQSREILAFFLIDLERPLLISEENFIAYQKAEKATISFQDLGQIVDVFSPAILDALAVRDHSILPERRKVRE